jgi:hypothetical protein
MIISKIEKEDFIYYNLHAEQTITGAYFTGSSCSGVIDEHLTKSTLERILEDVNSKTDKIIVLDFFRLKDVSNNLKLDIYSISKECKVLIFKNINKNCVKKLEISNILNENNVKSGTIYITLYYSNESDKYELESTDNIFKEKFEEIVDKQTDDTIEEEYHHSSTVYLTKYIDVKRIISIEKSFFIYCLYELAVQINERWLIEIRKNKEEMPILVCQNLNTSYMASILSTFLNLDVLILDHIGPINTMYSSLNNKIEENKNYIIVSDVVCLGTEVKIVKSLITFLGGKIYGNISIIKLDTLKENHKQEEESKLKSISVCNINKENNFIDFKIKTALDN